MESSSGMKRRGRGNSSQSNRSPNRSNQYFGDSSIYSQNPEHTLTDSAMNQQSYHQSSSSSSRPGSRNRSSSNLQQMNNRPYNNNGNGGNSEYNSGGSYSKNSNHYYNSANNNASNYTETGNNNRNYSKREGSNGRTMNNRSNYSSSRRGGAGNNNNNNNNNYEHYANNTNMSGRLSYSNRNNNDNKSSSYNNNNNSQRNYRRYNNDNNNNNANYQSSSSSYNSNRNYRRYNNNNNNGENFQSTPSSSSRASGYNRSGEFLQGSSDRYNNATNSNNSGKLYYSGNFEGSNQGQANVNTYDYDYSYDRGSKGPARNQDHTERRSNDFYLQEQFERDKSELAESADHRKPPQAELLDSAVLSGDSGMNESAFERTNVGLDSKETSSQNSVIELNQSMPNAERHFIPETSHLSARADSSVKICDLAIGSKTENEVSRKIKSSRSTSSNRKKSGRRGNRSRDSKKCSNGSDKKKSNSYSSISESPSFSLASSGSSYDVSRSKSFSPTFSNVSSSSSLSKLSHSSSITSNFSTSSISMGSPSSSSISAMTSPVEFSSGPLVLSDSSTCFELKNQTQPPTHVQENCPLQAKSKSTNAENLRREASKKHHDTRRSHKPSESEKRSRERSTENQCQPESSRRHPEASNFSLITEMKKNEARDQLHSGHHHDEIERARKRAEKDSSISRAKRRKLKDGYEDEPEDERPKESLKNPNEAANENAKPMETADPSAAKKLKGSLKYVILVDFQSLFYKWFDRSSSSSSRLSSGESKSKVNKNMDVVHSNENLQNEATGERGGHDKSFHLKLAHSDLSGPCSDCEIESRRELEQLSEILPVISYKLTNFNLAKYEHDLNAKTASIRNYTAKIDKCLDFYEAEIKRIAEATSEVELESALDLGLELNEDNFDSDNLPAEGAPAPKKTKEQSIQEKSELLSKFNLIKRILVECSSRLAIQTSYLKELDGLFGSLKSIAQQKENAFEVVKWAKTTQAQLANSQSVIIEYARKNRQNELTNMLQGFSFNFLIDIINRFLSTHDLDSIVNC